MKRPHRKEIKKDHVAATIGEALSSQFELDFTLIACMTNTVMGSVWYIDSGASFHMMGKKYFFSDLEEKDLHMNIEFEEEGRYNVTGIGIVTF